MSVLTFLKATAVILPGSLICGGCAGVSYRALDASSDQRARGFRYYDTSPYLLVRTDGKGGLESSLEYLPDLGKLRHARPFQFLAANKSTFDFSEGTLSSGTSEGDGTAVPAAFLDAATKVASAALKAGADDPAAAKSGEGSGTAPRVYLFKIKQEGATWTLIGDSGFEPLYKTKY